MMPQSIEDAGIFSFPQGKRLAKFALVADELKLTGNRYRVIKPLGNATMGIFNLAKGAIVSGMHENNATM